MANPQFSFDPGVGSYDDTSETPDQKIRQASRAARTAGALGTAPLPVKTALPTGPKPVAAAPVAAPTPAPAPAPAPYVQPTTVQGEDEMIAAGFGSSNEDEIQRSLRTAEAGKLKADREFATEEARQKAASANREASIAEEFSTKLRETNAKQKAMLNSSYGQFAPTKESAKDIAGLFSILTFATMGAGTESKYYGMNALSALTGAMKGYKEGRDDLYKKALTAYDKNVAEFTKRTENSLKELKLAQEELSVDKDAAMARARAVAAMEAGSIAALKIRSGDLDGAIKALQTQATSVRTFKAKADESKLRHEDRQESLRLQGQRINIQVDRASAAATRRDEKAMQQIGPALRNIAENYAEGSADKLVGASTEDKKIVQGAYRAVEESEQVADFVAKNPKAVGAMAAIKNFIKMDAIKSIKNEDESAAAVEKSQAVDAAIDRAVQSGSVNKDEAEAAKILQKKLFGLALADVRGSGQRGSVYLDRQFQNLYDQASRQDTLINIIKERAEENNRNLRVYKLNVERHNNPEQFPLIETKSTTDYIKQRTPKSGVPENIEKALSGKVDGTGAKFGGKTYRVYGGIVKEVQE